MGDEMNTVWKGVTGALAAAALVVTAGQTAVAGDYNGDFMVRAGVSVVIPDASADVSATGLGGLVPGADADISTEVIPSLTLTYFLNKNIAAELFCCFAKHDVEGKGVLAGADLGDTWIFPPAVTLQYHFDPIAGFKPYVGAGVQFIKFFGESRSPFTGTKMSIDDAWGFTLQAGIDVELGSGWYANLDVKKTWLDTEASWGNTGGALGVVTADVDVDPLIVSANIGYRFNLSDLFGRRESYAPMK